MGFVFSKMWNPEEGMADLQGKVAVVTGGKYVWLQSTSP
jgi:hypothetical protein